jgi:hypothetical protein
MIWRFDIASPITNDIAEQINGKSSPKLTRLDSGMTDPMTDPMRFTVAFECPNCGQKGERHWEKGSNGTEEMGSNRAYINVSDGFHCELGRAANGEPIIVCNDCDEIQPD